MKEIERKFTIKKLPEDLAQYPRVRIEQGYLCTDPVVRVRRKGEEYWLSCKGAGLLVREEYELPLSQAAYEELMPKTEGVLIKKDRYYIPYEGVTIELDVFDEPIAPLIVAEVEFPTEVEALAFIPPDWFDKEVTWDPAYTNSSLSKR